MKRNPENPYLDTLARMEPDIAMVDPGAFYASASVSLKRLADAAEHQAISLKRLADHFCPSLAEPEEEVRQ